MKVLRPAQHPSLLELLESTVTPAKKIPAKVSKKKPSKKSFPRNNSPRGSNMFASGFQVWIQCGKRQSNRTYFLLEFYLISLCDLSTLPWGVTLVTADELNTEMDEAAAEASCYIPSEEGQVIPL